MIISSKKRDNVRYDYFVQNDYCDISVEYYINGRWKHICSCLPIFWAVPVKNKDLLIEKCEEFWVDFLNSSKTILLDRNCFNDEDRVKIDAWRNDMKGIDIWQ